jgi:hypothetical protein
MLEMALVLSILNSPHNPEAAMAHKCMIENLVYESADQGTKGMRLMAEVTLNRVDELESPRAYCDVVYEPYQFSWTHKEHKREYKDSEYHKAAQVLFSYLYGDLPRLLPKGTKHYLNKELASDMSWYDPNKVVMEYKDHAFLKL